MPGIYYRCIDDAYLYFNVSIIGLGLFVGFLNKSEMTISFNFSDIMDIKDVLQIYFPQSLVTMSYFSFHANNLTN